MNRECEQPHETGVGPDAGCGVRPSYVATSVSSLGFFSAGIRGHNRTAADHGPQTFSNGPTTRPGGTPPGQPGPSLPRSTGAGCCTGHFRPSLSCPLTGLSAQRRRALLRDGQGSPGSPLPPPGLYLVQPPGHSLRLLPVGVLSRGTAGCLDPAEPGRRVPVAAAGNQCTDRGCGSLAGGCPAGIALGRCGRHDSLRTDPAELHLAA